MSCVAWGDLPWAYSDALPVLYCVTLCMVCLRHSLPLQKARLVFGTFTCNQQRAHQ